MDYTDPIISECCLGCRKSAPGTNMECHVYGIVPNMYCRMGACPINPKFKAVVKGKINPLKASKRAKKGK